MSERIHAPQHTSCYIEQMDDPLPSLPMRSGIDVFIAAFEDGTLPKSRWTHAAHILTGSCYVHAFGERAALDRMRAEGQRL